MTSIQPPTAATANSASVIETAIIEFGGDAFLDRLADK
jgi:hypothetical protein